MCYNNIKFNYTFNDLFFNAMKITRKRILKAAQLDAYDINNDLLDLYDIIDGMLPDFETKMYALRDASEFLKDQDQDLESRDAAIAFKKASKLFKELEDLLESVDELANNF